MDGPQLGLLFGPPATYQEAHSAEPAAPVVVTRRHRTPREHRPPAARTRRSVAGAAAPPRRRDRTRRRTPGRHGDAVTGAPATYPVPHGAEQGVVVRADGSDADPLRADQHADPDGGALVARVTLQTIADRVGVSRMTVSNAFSRPDQLSAEMRRTILDAAADARLRRPGPVRARAGPRHDGCGRRAAHRVRGCRVPRPHRGRVLRRGRRGARADRPGRRPAARRRAPRA